MGSRRWWPAILVVAATLRAAAQGPPAPAPTFSVRSDLVVIHATVTDRKGAFVVGLDRGAFTVYEDDVPQTIAFFKNEDSPVSVGLVIDNSGSMQTTLDAVLASGLAFARASHPDDEMFTLNFNEQVTAGLPPEAPFTNDLVVLRRALLTATAMGRTALYDALASAIRYVATGTRQKKVLVLISDGGDNASRTRLDEVLTLARQSDVVIYAIGLLDQYDRDAKPRVLKQLAGETGGEHYFPKRVEECGVILGHIAREIRSGYTIGYAPTNPALDGSYRRIRVTATPPGNARLNVRARTGYLAPSRTTSREP